MKRRKEPKEIGSYRVKCNNCKESINFTSENQFPIKLKCPQCGSALTIEKSERNPFVVTLLGQDGFKERGK